MKTVYAAVHKDNPEDHADYIVEALNSHSIYCVGFPVLQPTIEAAEAQYNNPEDVEILKITIELPGDK